VYYANCILQRPFKFGGYVVKDVTDASKDGVNSFYEYSFADMPPKYNHILVLAKSQNEGYEQSHYGPQDFIKIPATTSYANFFSLHGNDSDKYIQKDFVA